MTIERLIRSVAGTLTLGLLAGAGCAPTNNPTPHIGFVDFQEESPWRTELNRSFLDEADRRGYDVTFRNAADDIQQAEFIAELAGMNLDALFIAPKVLSLASAVQAAADTGTQVILIDRLVDETIAVPGQAFKTHIGFDMREEGTLAAEFIIANAPTKLGAGPYNILQLEGTVGSSPQIDRKAGFEEEIATNGSFVIVQDSLGDFNSAQAQQIVTDAIDASLDFNVIFAHNDGMALGAIAALEAAALDPADYMIVGIDAFKGAIDAISTNKMDATITCFPSLGPIVLDTYERIVAGETVPLSIKVENVTCDEAAVAAAAANTSDTHEFCDGFGTSN